jgi:transcriptional regulator with XRE-family HTH domain
MANYPVAAFVRTLRRIADLSQREIADRCGLPRQAIATMETRPDLARVERFDRLVGVAGLRLVIVDREGRVVEPDDDLRVRDRGGRHYPAHLDVRPASEGWWGSSWPMFYGREPEYTFDRNRRARDRLRGHLRLLPELDGEERPGAS